MYLIYLWCDSKQANAKADLLPVAKKLFNFSRHNEQDKQNESQKPNVIWSCYYNQEHVDCNSSLSSDINLESKHFMVSTPCNELDYDQAIIEVGLFIYFLFYI